MIKKVERATRKAERVSVYLCVNKGGEVSPCVSTGVIELVALLEFFGFADFVFLFDTAGASQFTSAPVLGGRAIESAIT